MGKSIQKRGKKRKCGGQLKVFEKREMTVNGEGNGWTKKVETIESVSEKYFFLMLKATRKLKKKRGGFWGQLKLCEKKRETIESVIEKYIFFLIPKQTNHLSSRT